MSKLAVLHDLAANLCCSQSFVRCLAGRMGLCPVFVPHVAHIYIKIFTHVNLCAWISLRVCDHSEQKWRVLNTNTVCVCMPPSLPPSSSVQWFLLTCYLLVKIMNFDFLNCLYEWWCSTDKRLWAVDKVKLELFTLGSQKVKVETRDLVSGNLTLFKPVVMTLFFILPGEL